MTTTDQNLTPVMQERVGMFSLRGRMGRARYIAYTLGTIFLLFLVMLLAGTALMLAGPFGRMLYIVFAILLCYGLLPLCFAILTIRRAHDFNFRGWIALLLFVPIVNPLLFWLIPGTKQDNTYGPAPQEDPLYIKLAAVILPFLLIGFYLATGEMRIYRQEADTPTQPATSLKPYTP